MAENILYINEGLHTGQVRQTVDRLCTDQSQVVSTYLQRLNEADIALSDLSPFALAGVISPRRLPKPVRNSWNMTEVEISRFLASMHTISEPYDVLDETEAVVTLSNRNSLEMVRDFWEQNSLVVLYLMSKEARQDLNLFNLSLGAYYESRVLRAAVFSGIYCKNPLLA